MAQDPVGVLSQTNEESVPWLIFRKEHFKPNLPQAKELKSKMIVSKLLYTDYEESRLSGCLSYVIFPTYWVQGHSD